MKWYYNKIYFTDRLGEKLIWESNDILTFHLSEEQKKYRRDTFIENIESGIIRDFLECNLYGFFDNKTIGDYRFSYDEDDSRTFVVPAGMKIGKDAMGTMANTLVLAYVGGSLNMMVLIYSICIH